MSLERMHIGTATEILYSHARSLQKRLGKFFRCLLHCIFEERYKGGSTLKFVLACIIYAGIPWIRWARSYPRILQVCFMLIRHSGTYNFKVIADLTVEMQRGHIGTRQDTVRIGRVRVFSDRPMILVLLDM